MNVAVLLAVFLLTTHPSTADPVEGANVVCNGVRVLLVDIGWGRLGNVLMQFAPAFGLRHQYDLVLLRGMVGSVWVERREQPARLAAAGSQHAQLSQWVQCFPNIGSYVLGQPVLTLAEMKSRLIGWAPGVLTGCPVLQRLLDTSGSITALTNGLFEAIGRENWTVLTEPLVGVAIARRDQFNKSSHGTALPPFAMTLHQGTGSWWQHFDWFIGPQLFQLRTNAFALQCCQSLSLISEDSVAVTTTAPDTAAGVSVAAEDGASRREFYVARRAAVNWTDPRYQYVVHMRDFRHEEGRDVQHLLTRPTLRPQYMVKLLRDQLGARDVLVLTEPRYSQSEEADVIRAGWPDGRAVVMSGPQHLDFCVMVRTQATLLVSPGSTFSYWAAILSRSARVIVPRILGEHTVGEVAAESGKKYREPWPQKSLVGSSVLRGSELHHHEEQNRSEQQPPAPSPSPAVQQVGRMNADHLVPFEYVIVPHWAIDTRSPQTGDEQSWDDRTFKNGTARPRPVHCQGIHCEEINLK